MTFDPTKPVQTRDGRKARILAADLVRTPDAIAAAVFNSRGTETIITYKPDGSLLWNGGDSSWDLVNIPEKKVYKMFITPEPWTMTGEYISVTTVDNKIVKVELAELA